MLSLCESTNVFQKGKKIVTLFFVKAKEKERELDGSRHSKNKRQTYMYAFRDDISSRGKKRKTKTDAKMESHPKSATAENNLQNTSDYIVQKKVNRSKTCSLEQNSKGSLAATTKPHRGVCVGLTYDLSYLEFFFYKPIQQLRVHRPSVCIVADIHGRQTVICSL